MQIAAVGRAFPDNYYDQKTLIEAFKKHWAKRHYNVDRLESLHRNVLVGGRHLALPLEEYEGNPNLEKPANPLVPPAGII